MHRYFVEVSYKGTNYSGFQVQQNANSIQAEVEKALKTYFRTAFELTGSSRTDAGVHALQNYFHFDSVHLLIAGKEAAEKALYHLNAILPADIVIKSIKEVAANAHCRFDAVSRAYRYYIYQHKDPFQVERAWYYPYTIDIDLLQQAAGELMKYEDFTSFSKRNTQVFTFNCTLIKSQWLYENGCYIYSVEANRFLRGMVRGLVGTMLQVGRNRKTLEQFKNIIEAKDCTKVDFAVPAHGLYLVNVNYPGLM
jgi:tRNA pseudouridine38-40 synthase